MTTANEDWRTDPVRRGEWRDALQARAQAVREAYEHLRRASEVINDAGPIEPDSGGGAIYERIRTAIWNARHEAARNLRWCVDSPTDTYIGNMAAFGRPHERTSRTNND